MENRKRINIGFDIGITSVGWAIVDEDNNIIDRGVRLFKELTDEKGKLKNENRRQKRHLRRTIRRQRNRKDDFIKGISRLYYDIFNFKEFDDFEETKANFLSTYICNGNNDIFEIITRGLKQEISKEELLKILYYYLSHRGFSYMTLEKYEKINQHYNTIAMNQNYQPYLEWFEKNIDSNDEVKKQEANKYEKFYKNDFSSISIFLSAVKSYFEEKNKEWYIFDKEQNKYVKNFPSLIQKNFFHKNEYFRGNKTINSDFSIFDFENEIKKILSNQSYIKNTSFVNWYIDGYEVNGKNIKGIFKRLRNFGEGPGSEISRSDYGIYTTKKKNGKYETLNNLWDKNIGNCSVFTKEYRADKKSMSSEISNLLNQLNQIKININKNRETQSLYLTENEKKKIIFESLLNNKKVVLRTIADKCNITIGDILGGYPTEEKKGNNNKTCFEEASNTRKLVNIFKDEIKNYDDLINKRELFNNIVNIFSKNPENITGIIHCLKEINIDDNKIDLIIKSQINGKDTSSMSLKALNIFIDEEIKNDGKTLNQKFKSLIDSNVMERFNFNNSISKYINVKCLDNEMMISPTTKCSFRETLKVFNKILKKYVYNGNQKYFINNIVMEMPTEWNTKKQQDKIKKIQNANKEMEKIIEETYKYTRKGSNDNTYKKLVLLYQQNGNDIYTGKHIEYENVINNAGYAHIEHIIPRSISFDDSLNNKVLTLWQTNIQKGECCPRDYLSRISTKEYILAEKRWKELYYSEKALFPNKKKYENLTIDLSSDNNKYYKSIGFIGRNLSDTRYACRIANTALNNWIKHRIKYIKENGIVSEDEIFCNVKNNEDVNFININGKITQRYRGKDFLDIKKDRDIDYSHHAIDATICAILGNSKYTTQRLIWIKENDDENKKRNFDSKFLGDNWETKIDKSDKNIDWKKIKDNVAKFPVKYSYKIMKKTNFGFYDDSTISVRRMENEYKQFSNVKILEYTKYSEIYKEMNKLIELYGTDINNKHPDKKMWIDILKAWSEGDKIRIQNKEFIDINPFRLYMDKYCEINNIPVQYKYLILERNNYRYKVSKIKFFKNINSFFPVNNFHTEKMNNDEKFGVKSGLGWKWILLFDNSKEDKEKKYKILPIGLNFLDKKLKNIDEPKLNNFLNDNKIKNNNYFKIDYGYHMVNKNDKKDLRKIVGHKFSDNALDIQEIYKPSKQKQVSINTIMQNYDFCTVDVLGNITKIDIDKILRKKEG